MDAVRAEGLVKKFGDFRALDGLDLRVESGEVHGFLGPNGAGKSTAIRILLGLMRFDGGRCEVLGGNPWKDAADLHRRIAYVPDNVALWPNLTGGEALDLLGRLRGGIDENRREELIERFELDTTKKGRAYSTGNRQKVALISALASDAELLICDEPTAGLDPLKEAEFRTQITRLRDEGRTVLLSSHILAEVEALCDRVTIIRSGRTVEAGSLTELRHLQRITVEVETERSVADLVSTPGVHDLRSENARAEFELDPSYFDSVMRLLADHGIRSLISRPPTLEQLFLRHYGEELTAEEVDGGSPPGDNSPAGDNSPPGDNSPAGTGASTTSGG